MGTASTPKVFSLSVTGLERQWLLKSLDAQRKSVVRSKANELEGSEVIDIRNREISAIDALVSKINSATEV